MLGAGMLALGTVKTAAKITEGQDPSITDAFLTAAGLLSVAPVPQGAVSDILSVFDPLKPGQRIEPLEDMPHVPAKPQLDWSQADISNHGVATGAAHAAKDGASIQPLTLAPDDPIIHEITDKMTPSPADQVAAGEDVVVLGSKVTGIRQYVEDGKHITSLTIEQQVADASDLRLENIMGLISSLNRGEEISVSDVFVAVVNDLFEQPGEILKHILHPGQVYAALRGSRTVNVDIISASITRKDSQDLGTLTKDVKFDRQTPVIDATINAELSRTTEQTISRTLNVQQVQYQWGEVQFADYVSNASEADLAAGAAEEARVEETIITTTDHGIQAVGRVNIADDSSYNAATAVNHQQTVDIERRVYSADGDVLAAAADGRLTDDELRSSNIHVENEETWREAEFNYQEAADAGKTWATGNDPAIVAAARREIEPALQVLLAQMAAGQPVDSLAAGRELSDAVLAARHRTGPISGNPQSTMSAEYQEDGPVRSNTISSERHEEVDWGMDKKIRTETTNTVQSTYSSQISADQLIMETRYRGTGIYDRPGELPPPRREIQAFITVNEVSGEIRTSMDSTVTSKTAFDVDTAKVLGRDTDNSATKIDSATTSTRKTYKVQNNDIAEAISDGRLTSAELQALDAEFLQMDKGETVRTNSLDQSTAKRAFESGWIDYAPLGSIASAGMKSSFGYELTGSDYFWAVADGALTVATLGAGSVLIKGGGKAAAKGIAKNVMKGELKKAGQQTIKAGGQVISNVGKNVVADIKAPFTAAKDGIQYVAKHGPLEATKEVGRQVVGRGKMVINTVTGNKFDLDKLVVRSDQRHGIRTGARQTINSKYAGKTFPASEFKDTKLRELYPDGIKFTTKGYPDFGPYATRKIKINDLTGNHATDFAKANKAVGYPKTPDGFTWHHHQNGKDMLLVPTKLHDAVRHSGGASLLKEQSAIVGQIGRSVATTVNLGSKIAIKPDSWE